MRNRTMWTYYSTAGDAIDDLLAVRKCRAYWCARCEYFHAEGLDSRFLDHYRGEEMQQVATTLVADYRERRQREHAG